MQISYPPATGNANLDVWLQQLVRLLELSIIETDRTQGLVLRHSSVVIVDGTNANTLKCTVASLWNGDTVAETDNIAKDATTGNFSLSADGSALTIEAAGLEGNVIASLAINLYDNNSTSDLLVQHVAISNDLVITVRTSADGAVADMTSLVDTGGLYIDVLYLTDA